MSWYDRRIAAVLEFAFIPSSKNHFSGDACNGGRIPHPSPFHPFPPNTWIIALFFLRVLQHRRFDLQSGLLADARLGRIAIWKPRNTRTSAHSRSTLRTRPATHPSP